MIERRARIRDAAKLKEYKKAYYERHREELLAKAKIASRSRRLRVLASESVEQKAERLIRDNARKRDCNARKTLEQRREQKRKLRYGLSRDDYRALWNAQGGRCPGCIRSLDDCRVVVDHCHATGRIRALLCHECNVVLGLVDENEVTLVRLSAFVLRHRARTA